MKSDTIPIIYGAGSYGNYLYWVLNNFTSLGLHDSPGLPWGRAGNSHKQKVNAGYRGKRAEDGYKPSYAGWAKYIKSDMQLSFFIAHYYYDTDEDSDPNARGRCIDDILALAHKGIVIESDLDTQLLTLSNAHSKTNPKIDWIYRYFGIDKNSPMDFREEISYKLFNRGQIDYKSTNCLAIRVHDLLFDFEIVLGKICSEFNLTLTNDLSVILDNHISMLTLQEHLHIDQYVAEFLECFINHKDYTLPSSSIITEAFIQKYIRDELGLELKCIDIGNDFPKTTKELLRYL